MMPRSVHDRLFLQELAMAFGVCHDCHGLGCYCCAPGSPCATPLPFPGRSWHPLPPCQPQNIKGGGTSEMCGRLSNRIPPCAKLSEKLTKCYGGVPDEASNARYRSTRPGPVLLW